MMHFNCSLSRTLSSSILSSFIPRPGCREERHIHIASGRITDHDYSNVSSVHISEAFMYEEGNEPEEGKAMVNRKASYLSYRRESQVHVISR